MGNSSVCGALSRVLAVVLLLFMGFFFACEHFVFLCVFSCGRFMSIPIFVFVFGNSLYLL